MPTLTRLVLTATEPPSEGSPVQPAPYWRRALFAPSRALRRLPVRPREWSEK